MPSLAVRYTPGELSRRNQGGNFLLPRLRNSSSLRVIHLLIEPNSDVVNFRVKTDTVRQGEISELYKNGKHVK